MTESGCLLEGGESEEKGGIKRIIEAVEGRRYFYAYIFVGHMGMT